MFEPSRYPTVKELREYLNSLSPEKDDWGAFIIPSSETHQFSNNVYISLTSPEKEKFVND